MTKTLKIEGMMCMHCQAHMDKALNAMEGVTATVDQPNGTATVTCDASVTDEMFRKVVEEAGYKLIAIE